MPHCQWLEVLTPDLLNVVLLCLTDASAWKRTGGQATLLRPAKTEVLVEAHACLILLLVEDSPAILATHYRRLPHSSLVSMLPI